MSEEKKIIIDEDWKAQVEAEKAAAKEAPSESAPSGAGPGEPMAADSPIEKTRAEATPVSEGPVAEGPGSDGPATDPPMPPASIGMLMSSLATEALISMGQMPHPATGQANKQLNQAKYLIDTLDVIKQKTAGNLTDDESTALDDVLHQLRMAFIASK